MRGANWKGSPMWPNTGPCSPPTPPHIGDFPPMLAAADMKPHEGVYTFVDPSGKNTNIASNRLHDWCATANLETMALPVTAEMANRFLRDNAVSMDRIFELLGKETLSPVIVCHDGFYGSNGGPNIFFVDGHHRYVLASMMGRTWIPCYFLTVPQWSPFQIEGLADLTSQQLIDIPLIKRNY